VPDRPEAAAMSLIKDARIAAMYCVDHIKRRVLIERTDELQNIFGLFTVSCDQADMEQLVGAWTRVVIAMKNLPPLPEHGPKGGRQPLPTKNKVELEAGVG
jgi:hypothetical protein